MKYNTIYLVDRFFFLDAFILHIHYTSVTCFDARSLFLDHYGFISNRNPTNTNDMFPARTGAKWFQIILHFIIEKNVDYEVVIYLSTSKVRKSFTLKYFKINI